MSDPARLHREPAGYPPAYLAGQTTGEPSLQDGHTLPLDALEFDTGHEVDDAADRPEAAGPPPQEQASLLMGFLADFHAAGREPPPPKEPPPHARGRANRGARVPDANGHTPVPAEDDPYEFDELELESPSALPTWPPPPPPLPLAGAGGGVESVERGVESGTVVGGSVGVQPLEAPVAPRPVLPDPAVGGPAPSDPSGPSGGGSFLRRLGRRGATGD